MKIKLLTLSVLFLVSCINDKKNDTAINRTPNQTESKPVSKKLDLEVYDFEGFEKFLNRHDGNTYVVNFWATWCAPCVKELPYFEKLNAEYRNEKVEVLLVSLDFPHLYEKKLMPFIRENKLQSRVVALDDPDMNSWIPKVSENWSGSIPATIIYKNDTREFYEQSFTYEELKEKLNPFLNR
ncbi:TlpA family protein disulfide reductase [Flavisericum labens]|uniref:TlpA family protein disulfide reductase n=1 Tax=Flavisericum labens TaxID=3377112 RepID=UPI00387AC322